VRRLTAGAQGTAAGGRGGFLIHNGRRLILGGIAALVLAFAVEFVLPSGGRQEIEGKGPLNARRFA
jgi:hypothetical protein